MPEGDGQSLRLTYAQLAEARGISRASAERLVRARKWPRILGNDGVAIVIVPPGEASPGSGGGSAPGSGGGKPGGRRRPRTPPHDPPPDHAPELYPDIRGMIEAAVAPLREQLEHERERADRAEQQITALRNELAEARIAERVATTETTNLRCRLDQADTDRRQTLDWLATAQERIIALLSDQRTTPPAPPRRSWLPWRRRA